VSITAIARNDIEKEYIMSGMGDKLKGMATDLAGDTKQAPDQQTNNPQTNDPIKTAEDAATGQGQGITGEVEGEAEKLLKEKMKG